MKRKSQLKDGSVLRARKALFIENIPGELYRAFRAWCVLRDKKLRDVIIALMRETIKNQELPPLGK